MINRDVQVTRAIDGLLNALGAAKILENETLIYLIETALQEIRDERRYREGKPDVDC